jgi:phenylacetate-CoA ligase
MTYWQEEVETMNRADLEKLQLKRLKETIEKAGHSAFYKDFQRAPDYS